jgi:hypothetical protein
VADWDDDDSDEEEGSVEGTPASTLAVGGDITTSDTTEDDPAFAPTAGGDTSTDSDGDVPASALTAGEDSTTDTNREVPASALTVGGDTFDSSASGYRRSKRKIQPESPDSPNKRSRLDNLNEEVLVGSNDEVSEASIKGKNAKGKAVHMKSIKEKVQLKRFDVIEYKSDDGDEWKTATILNRCKTSGSFKNCFNVRPANGQPDMLLNMEMVTYWQITVEEVHTVMVPREEHSTEPCVKAKQEELDKLAHFGTYEIVDDEGQFRISAKWVLWYKGEDIRARLTARGFEELEEIQSDSPTVAKSTKRLLLLIAASKSRTIKTTDIKSAFLQGRQLDRKVLLKPPREAGCRGKLWLLKKPLYGLNDASRQWYMEVKLGCKTSIHDPALFFFHNSKGKLSGCICLHVDDFLHCGTSPFEELVMKKVTTTFVAGKIESGSFNYVGFNVEQTGSHIKLSQNHFTEDIEDYKIESDRLLSKDELLDPTEQSVHRQLTGSLNWLVRGSRPDLAFTMIEASTKFKKAKLADLQKIIKTIRKAKTEKSEILIPNLGDHSDWTIEVYTDAALGNLNNGVDSTGANIISVTNSKKQFAAIDWECGKIKRVVRSTLAAEALSLIEGIENAFLIRNILEEVLNLSTGTIPIKATVDNLAVHSTTSVDDKRLRRDIGAIRQMLERKEVS